MPELTNLQQLQLNKEIQKAKDDLEKNFISYEKMVDITGFNPEMTSIIHKTVAKNTTIPELAYFLSICKGVGLNPLVREIWCYKDNRDNVITFTGRDGFLKKNKENPLYLGMRSSDVCEFDDFEIDMIEGKVSHIITNNRGKVIGAYAIVYYEGKKDTIKWLDFEEYNLGQAKWKTSPKMMIKKCAESAALKEAAGITGIQSEESFLIKNDVAFSNNDNIQPESYDKEKERLMALIDNAKNPASLKKLMNECTTPELIDLYDMKMKELLSNQ